MARRAGTVRSASTRDRACDALAAVAKSTASSDDQRIGRREHDARIVLERLRVPLQRRAILQRGRQRDRRHDVRVRRRDPAEIARAAQLDLHLRSGAAERRRRQRREHCGIAVELDRGERNGHDERSPARPFGAASRLSARRASSERPLRPSIFSAWPVTTPSSTDSSTPSAPRLLAELDQTADVDRQAERRRQPAARRRGSRGSR